MKSILVSFIALVLGHSAFADYRIRNEFPMEMMLAVSYIKDYGIDGISGFGGHPDKDVRVLSKGWMKIGPGETVEIPEDSYHEGFHLKDPMFAFFAINSGNVAAQYHANLGRRGPRHREALWEYPRPFVYFVPGNQDPREVLRIHKRNGGRGTLTYFYEDTQYDRDRDGTIVLGRDPYDGWTVDMIQFVRSRFRDGGSIVRVKNNTSRVLTFTLQFGNYWRTDTRTLAPGDSAYWQDVSVTTKTVGNETLLDVLLDGEDGNGNHLKWGGLGNGAGMPYRVHPVIWNGAYYNLYETPVSE